MYHSVGACADDPYLVTVSPDRLERQLTWLNRRGLTGVGVAELLRARADGRGNRLVGLTFDDGYADFVEHAVPLLLRYGHSATVFVLPGRLGGDNEWDELGPRKTLLTEEGIRAAAAAGMEIGSHGLVHQDLTQTADGVLAGEVRGSRDRLQEITGKAPAGFCYPYGKVDARVVNAVAAAGYGYGCAVAAGPLTGTHALPRAYVGERDTDARLDLKRLRHLLRRRPLPFDSGHAALPYAREAAPGAGGRAPGRPAAGSPVPPEPRSEQDGR
ncbi:polysaccharide deacetylase family protein [Streptomyces sp. SPB162]|uniref:polysaccharide deacetylase family protein n=1 Tax=Streptomyces sp. SPB162 TaxID=2940560 RepID=UPI002406AB4A|nr:polysaccharide deacetylase family protein [Streptomyces sp. SPB162]